MAKSTDSSFTKLFLNTCHVCVSVSLSLSLGSGSADIEILSPLELEFIGSCKKLRMELCPWKS